MAQSHCYNNTTSDKAPSRLEDTNDVQKPIDKCEFLTAMGFTAVNNGHDTVSHPIRRGRNGWQKESAFEHSLMSSRSVEEASRALRKRKRTPSTTTSNPLIYKPALMAQGDRQQALFPPPSITTFEQKLRVARQTTSPKSQQAGLPQQQIEKHTSSNLVKGEPSNAEYRKSRYAAATTDSYVRATPIFLAKTTLEKLASFRYDILKQTAHNSVNNHHRSLDGVSNSKNHPSAGIKTAKASESEQSLRQQPLINSKTQNQRLLHVPCISDMLPKRWDEAELIEPQRSDVENQFSTITRDSIVVNVKSTTRPEMRTDTLRSFQGQSTQPGKHRKPSKNNELVGSVMPMLCKSNHYKEIALELSSQTMLVERQNSSEALEIKVPRKIVNSKYLQPFLSSSDPRCYADQVSERGYEQLMAGTSCRNPIVVPFETHDPGKWYRSTCDPQSGLCSSMDGIDDFPIDEEGELAMAMLDTQDTSYGTKPLLGNTGLPYTSNKTLLDRKLSNQKLQNHIAPPIVSTGGSDPVDFSGDIITNRSPAVVNGTEKILTQVLTRSTNGATDEEATGTIPKTKQVVMAAGNDFNPLQPFARPNFPKPVREMSPIPGISSNTVLRTCFRIGEAIRIGGNSLISQQDVIIELFARIRSSFRELKPAKQHFQFSDIFHDRPPYPDGLLFSYMVSELQEAESSALLGVGAVGRKVRCLGRLVRGPRTQQLLLRVISIRTTDWEEIRHTKHVGGARTQLESLSARNE